MLEIATGRTTDIGFVQAFAWDRDGETLLVFDRPAHEIRRIDMVTGATQRFPFAHDSVIALAGAGGRVFAGGEDGAFVAGGSAWPTGHGDPVFAIVPLPDGRIASASTRPVRAMRAEEIVDRTQDAIVTISDGSHGVARLTGHRSPVKALAVSPSGQIASADTHGEIRIWTRTPVAAEPGREHVPAAFLDIARTHLLEINGKTTVRIDLATGVASTIAAPATGIGGRRPRRIRAGAR